MQKGDRLPASDRIESRLKSIARRMAPRASRLAAAGGIAAAAALGACVAAQQSNPNSFSADRAVQVFAAGYESIATRFVDNVPPRPTGSGESGRWAAPGRPATPWNIIGLRAIACSSKSGPIRS